MGGIESNNAKMTLQNVKAKFQCNVTIVQSLYKSIKESESILKIQPDLFLAFTDVNKRMALQPSWNPRYMLQGLKIGIVCKLEQKKAGTFEIALHKCHSIFFFFELSNMKNSNLFTKQMAIHLT